MEFSVATCSRATPFHWALLRTLESFQPGCRPDFTAIAERLHFHEPAFLSQSWTELCSDGAVTSVDFDTAEITDIGTEALRIGFILTSPADTRRISLVFSVRDGRCIERHEFDLVQGSLLRKRPVWANELGLDAILNAMSHQMPLQLPSGGERITEFKLLWDEACDAVAKW